MSEVSKPITIAREEFVNKLIDLCNKSGMPFFCVESILKDLIQEVHTASIKQYEEDKSAYERALDQQEE